VNAASRKLPMLNTPIEFPREIKGTLHPDIEGKLVGDSVDELRRVWTTIRSESPNKETVVERCAVRIVDRAGRKLLRQMHEWGARLAGRGLVIRPLIDEIVDPGDSP